MRPWIRNILVGLGLVGGGLLLAGAALDSTPVDMPVTDHFDGERFSLPGGENVGNKGFADLLRWQTSREPVQWPEAVPVTPVVPAARVEGEALVATMVGHATVLVQTAGLNILTDPIWSERASPVSFAGPKRVTAPGIRFGDLPRIDLVVVSHGHWDHLDVPSLKMLWKRDRPLILVPLGHGAMLAAEGVEVREVDWGEAVAVGPAMVIAEPVQHWTSRWFIDRNRALWAGYTVVLPGGNVYFAGDTGYGDGQFFRDVKRHGPVRLAMLPVGAYEPRWFMAEQHMNPAEAVQAKIDLEAAHSLGLHWGTFQLTDEGREEPLAALQAALAGKGIEAERFPALAAGKVLSLETTATQPQRLEATTSPPQHIAAAD
jgi:L-ascorbate metabolism protein UlaG (beta-lactamase superfamily)